MQGVLKKGRGPSHTLRGGIENIERFALKEERVCRS